MVAKREITAIAILLSINAFFGLSDKTTKFIFPEFGQEVFDIINFYLLVILVFTVIVIWLDLKHGIPALPNIPSIWTVITTFTIFFIPSYFLITWLVSGTVGIPAIFQYKVFIEQSIIASDENLLAFILLPTIFPYGTGVGNIFRTPMNLFKFRDYRLDFNPPNWNRFKYGLYAIGFVTLLHAGSYSYQVATVSDFYVSLTIAFILFNFLWFTKESFGFGSCIAVHTSWNLVLITLRGAVI